MPDGERAPIVIKRVKKAGMKDTTAERGKSLMPIS